MYKVHPTEKAQLGKEEDGRRAELWTVWKKSSMAFQGTDGFMAFDGSGRLAFRVDNYSRRSKCLAGELVLMDGEGKPLFTLKPQILSMHDRWNVYEGEGGDTRSSAKTPVFSMRRSSVFQDEEVEVFARDRSWLPLYKVHGCFGRRHCKIWHCGTGEFAAEIMKKKASAGKSVMLGDDVFSLVVHPGFDSVLIMAFVVVMDRMCRRSFSSLMCS